ncbi:MAG: GspH/FimT family pseudopilin [Gammaproteobacteria bacterium]|nr:GspH/FimT family pseudopilin [Gammaproteobacteria bacterium]
MARVAVSGGYSLYELVMTLGLIGLVLTLGIPSFGSIVANHRLRTEVDHFFHAIHLARMTSIYRRKVVTLCPSRDGEFCDETTDWSAGWIMFQNDSRHRAHIRDASEPILRRHRPFARHRLTANRRTFSLRSTELRATNGTVLFCDDSGKAKPRALVISYTGRPRVAYADRSGRPYVCDN